MKYLKAKAKKFSKDKPVGPPSSQDLLHKAWEHLLLKSSPLVHQDTRNSPQQQMHCQKQQIPFDAKFIWQTTGSKFGREREKTVWWKEGYHISAPTPCWGNPSSTVMSLLVFLTEALIAALSSGRIERRFITCTEKRSNHFFKIP